MKRTFGYYVFRMVRFLVKLFYPRMRWQGLENLPQEPAIYVGNHTQMNGPIACELYFPVPSATWCIGEMMVLKEVPAYAFQDFWSQKPRWTHPFYRGLSYLIAPLSVALMNNASTIPVYHDFRVLTTFRESVKKLMEGTSVVIFPEYDKKYNHILYEFQENFVDTARYYYRKTKKPVSFVPFYIAPRLKTMYYGHPIVFNPDAPIEEERTRICTYLKEEITRLAEAAPVHTVVPYRNIPKKDYPTNVVRR